MMWRRALKASLAISVRRFVRGRSRERMGFREMNWIAGSNVKRRSRRCWRDENIGRQLRVSSPHFKTQNQNPIKMN